MMATNQEMRHSPLPLAAERTVLDPRRRDQLVRRARFLARIGLAWHGAEAAIAIGAGAIASSIALVGFGADSLVEAVAGVIVIWRFAASRSMSEEAEQRAQKLIAASFFLIAAYVAIDAIRTIVTGDYAGVSWIGIGLAAFTAATMPPLALAKAKVGTELNSSSTASEGRQNMLCAYLSGALLVGLGGNALFGLWWLDPVTALLIAAVAVREGREAWRGEACGCCDPVVESRVDDGCEDDCCTPHHLEITHVEDLSSQ